jgi:glucose-1-phosphate cytidylyltransferase
MIPTGDGYRPILSHVMKYYAHFGHKDFILCLGYKRMSSRNISSIDEAVWNDLVLSNGGRKLQLLSGDIDDWNITLADTGLYANIGQRLNQVKKYVEGEEMFLANYADGLTGLLLPTMIDHYPQHAKIASLLAVRPTRSLHFVSLVAGGIVKGYDELRAVYQWRLFIFKSEIFDYINERDGLVEQPFERLIENQLVSYP